MTVTDETVVPLQHADKFFIDGNWVDPSSGATIDVIDSSTEKIYFSVPEAQAADIDRAVTAARTAFDDGPWPRLSHVERAEFLTGFAAGLRDRAEDIGQIWPRESGALHVIARYGASGIAAAFDYYAEPGHDLPLRGAGTAAVARRFRPPGPRAGRRGRRHHPVERPDRADHAQDRPGPAGRLHRGAQVLTGGSGRRLRGGRDRRGYGPPAGRAQCRHRRPGGVRAARPRSPGGQDHLHRFDRRGAPDRLHLWRADRPLHPGAGREVGRARSSTTWIWTRPPRPWPGRSAC